jgi:hypothetical protein
VSADEFASKKTEVTAAIAYVLEVHPTMLEVTVKGAGRRLAVGDSVILEAKVFVTPAAAAAMEAKITTVQADPAVLNSKVSAAAGPTVTATATVADPTQTAGQTPPAAPTPAPESKELKDEKKSNAGAAIGGALGGIAGLGLLYYLYRKCFHKDSFHQGGNAGTQSAAKGTSCWPACGTSCWPACGNPLHCCCWPSCFPSCFHKGSSADTKSAAYAGPAGQAVDSVKMDQVEV